MKLITYNILAGGRTRLPKIISLLKQLQPDILALQEAVGFLNNGGALLKLLAAKLGLPYYDLSPAAKYDFSVATFAKFPMTNVQKIPLLQNSCLIATLNTEPFGEITFCNAHLCPFTETERVREINMIINKLKGKTRVILCGDMNSLSPDDNYPDSLVSQLDEKHFKQHTQNGKLSFRAISALGQSGLVDVAKARGKNHVKTAPTGIDLKEDGIPYTLPLMRLDYVFVSKDLLRFASGYEVIKTEVTVGASDHFPVVAEFNKN